jgi:acyl dehydratase
MSLDLSIVGAVTEPSLFAYDAKTVTLYALGIGAKRDELDYLYEGRGPKVYPTFAVVPTLDVVFSQLNRTGADISMVVHGGQSVIVRGVIPAAATLRTTGTVKGIYDLKRFAQIVLTTTTTLEDGSPVFDTEWSIIVRGAGGFGGSPPPKREDAVSIPKEQALLYRLSGDFNPLHADPEVATAVGFPQGPILHGLCTYGFAARAFAKSAHGGDASRIKRMDSQFRKPVWPGDTLITEAWRGEGRVVFQTSVKERNEQVVTGAFWEA